MTIGFFIFMVKIVLTEVVSQRKELYSFKWNYGNLLRGAFKKERLYLVYEFS